MDKACHLFSNQMKAKTQTKNLQQTKNKR
jgi:hypothetical protein